MQPETCPESREPAAHHDGEQTPVIAQYSGESGATVRNEVRGQVHGAVIQIAGDHYGDLTF